MLSFLKRDKIEAGAADDEGWAARLRRGLAATREHVGSQLSAVFGVGRKIDEAVYEELETVLLTGDIGIDATRHLLADLRARAKRGAFRESAELRGALKQSLHALLEPLAVPLDVGNKRPFVILMAGINGAGKTTSIGKLARLFQADGKTVILAAGDTFRAAAREQLKTWGERNQVTVISQEGGDPAAVIFDTIQAAIARKIDIVIADTAGRLPTQTHLMEELRKIKRAIAKAIPDAPHEVLLVLDANNGQNAVSQLKAFDDALGVTGIILTKLDGTAKGGVIAAIARYRPVPLRYIGIGENLHDMRPFDAGLFVDALLD